jgi:hypothetical protein
MLFADSGEMRVLQSLPVQCFSRRARLLALEKCTMDAIELRFHMLTAPPERVHGFGRDSAGELILPLDLAQKLGWAG